MRPVRRGALVALLAVAPTASCGGEAPELRVLARWVHDHATGAWLPAEEAVFVHSPGIASPMAHGIAAFASRAEAESLAARTDGEVMDFAGLAELARSGAFEQARVRER